MRCEVLVGGTETWRDDESRVWVVGGEVAVKCWRSQKGLISLYYYKVERSGTFSALLEPAFFAWHILTPIPWVFQSGADHPSIVERFE